MIDSKRVKLGHSPLHLIKKIALGGILVLLSLFFLGPLIILILGSVKPLNELISYPPRLFPSHFSFQNYKEAFVYGNFFLYFLNSLFVAGVGTILTLLLSGIAGYSLAKLRFRGNSIIFLILMSATMISTEAIMSGSFAVANKLGFYNKLWGIIIVTLSTPTGVFIMRQAFMGVPNSLLEAARIDGASEFKTFTLIVPLVKSSFGILAILFFMWRWNGFLWPYIMLSDTKKITFQVGLANLITADGVSWGVLIAASTVGVIPSIMIFLLFQKSFLSSHMSSGDKG